MFTTINPTNMKLDTIQYQLTSIMSLLLFKEEHEMGLMTDEAYKEAVYNAAKRFAEFSESLAEEREKGVNHG